MAAWLGTHVPLASVVSVSGVLQPQRVVGDDNGARPETEPTTEFMHNLHLRESRMMGCEWSAPEPDEQECAAAWQDFMPQTAADSRDAAFFLIQGNSDPVVPVPTPDAFAWHARQVGLRTRVVHVPAYGHTNRTLLDDPQLEHDMLAWVLEHQ
jgi:pimeloyl-ACP methyl ester carboxylesterase